MGSFDFTCCVSGLPIGAGDDVRYLLLTEYPFHTHYVHNRWIPRTFPLKAKYNDYGSVENVQEGLAQDIWLDGFKLDLVERGPGDNTCHDVPVRKDMGLKQILNAIWEDRILVRKDRLTEKCGKVYKGIPTMRRVRLIIKKAGFPLSDGNFEDGYMVSVQTRGFIRVRWEGLHKEENLLKIQPLLSERFSTMVTMGKRYVDQTEMIVAPKPLSNIKRHTSLKHKKVKYLKVAQAMIREDVWQAILSMEFKSWCNKAPTKVEGFRRAAREFWDDLKTFDDIEKIPNQVDRALCRMEQRIRRLDTKNVVATWTKNEFVEGLMTHFELMRQKNPNEDELRDFLNTVGEMAFVQYILSNLRYQWRPSDGSGPQCGEWKLHKEFAKKMAKVAANAPETLSSV